MPDDTDIYDMSDNPLADDADPQGVDDIDRAPELPQAQAPDPIDEAPETDRPTEAPVADPVAVDAAPAPTDPALSWLEAEYGVKPEEFKAAVEAQMAQAKQAQTDEQIQEGLKPLLESLWAKVNAGELTEELAGELYQRELRVARAEARAAHLEAQLADSNRRSELERIRAEFPNAPADALDAYAAKGASANELRTLAGTLHKAVTNAREAAVAQYNAKRGALDAGAAAAAPARGAAPNVQGEPLDWKDVDGIDWDTATRR